MGGIKLERFFDVESALKYSLLALKEIRGEGDVEAIKEAEWAFMNGLI